MQLKGSTFIVTGGASGLGGATAQMVVEGGGNVVIADLKEAEGQAHAKELGAQAKFVRTDVTDEASAKGAVAAAVDAFGAVHGLVNCAGIVYGEKTVGKEGPHSLAGFVRTININLIGTFNMIAACRRGDGEERAERGRRARRDRQHRVGRRVRRADRAGAYSASKAGVAGMTLPIARDLSRSGIRVMTIAPGLFQTPMVERDSAGHRRSAGQDGAVSAAARAAGRVRFARRGDRAQRDAERRSDPPRRRDTDGAEIERALVPPNQRDRRGDHRDEEHERPCGYREAHEQPALLRAFAAAFQHLAKSLR